MKRFGLITFHTVKWRSDMRVHKTKYVTKDLMLKYPLEPLKKGSKDN